MLFDFLREPMLCAVDVDGDERLVLHRQILQRKEMLRTVFMEINDEFHRLANEYLTVDGAEVELGAGVAPMKEKYPNVLSTDIVAAKHLDMALNAENMQLGDASVRVFYAQNCFHHFPHPSQFFSELERTLKPGGGAVILEPYYGPMATFLFKRLFKTEGFDKKFPYWEAPVSGPMNGANQALSYIVFERDRHRFELEHPRLEIVHQSIMGNYLKYLLSGGLNFRQLLPDFLTGFINFIEKAMKPFNSIFGLHHIVVIRKIHS